MHTNTHTHRINMGKFFIGSYWKTIYLYFYILFQVMENGENGIALTTQIAVMMELDVNVNVMLLRITMEECVMIQMVMGLIINLLAHAMVIYL